MTATLLTWPMPAVWAISAGAAAAAMAVAWYLSGRQGK